jgi:MFS family permease
VTQPSYAGLRFPPLVWVVLAGTLLTRTAFFMVWPFLAVILARDFQLSSSSIGSIIGSAFFASAIVGFYAGHLSDRLGSRVTMMLACGGAMAAYVLLALANSVTMYSVGAFMVGLSRSALESPGKAVIGDHIADQRSRDLAFHVRYFLINVGAAVGPLFGFVFGLSAQQPTFWVTASAYGVFGLAVLAVYRWTPEQDHHDRPHARLVDALEVIRRDRRFLLMLSAMFLVMSAYAQQETTLIQYVNGQGGEPRVRLVTALLVTNAITIVLFQFPLLHLVRDWTIAARLYAGLALFAAAFGAYAVMPVRGMAPWVCATWILSVGESVLFPTLQLQMDRVAPAGMKGSYFGAAALAGLGTGFGPFVGGVLLEYAGGTVTFLATAASTVVAGACCRRAATRSGRAPGGS